MLLFSTYVRFIDNTAAYLERDEPIAVCQTNSYWKCLYHLTTPSIVSCFDINCAILLFHELNLMVAK